MRLSFQLLFLFASLVTASTSQARASCTGTIASLDDVDDAVKCTTVVINSFTVPAGETFTLKLAQGSTVNMEGDVTFGEKNWDGPLFMVTGKDITFNGNGHTFDGNGAFYWDGQGLNGGVTKPDPMMHVEISGTMTNVKVLNSPARAFSVANTAALTMSQITVDDSAGDQPNSKSGGKAAGHNTDGFDVSKDNLTIENSVVMNQDDCLAINKGSNIVFTGNTCSGGHGISVGSISSDVTVSGITISNNKILNSMQGLRIKTKASASGSTVSDITYSGNTGSGMTEFGVLIDQSYPDTLGTPGNGVKLSGVNFVGTKNTLSVNSGAQRVAVNCGSGSCSGDWEWTALSVTGGKAGPINFNGITGFTQ